MTKKEDKQPQAEPQPAQDTNAAAATMLATLLTIMRLREHRGERDE